MALFELRGGRVEAPASCLIRASASAAARISSSSAFTRRSFANASPRARAFAAASASSAAGQDGHTGTRFEHDLVYLQGEWARGSLNSVST